MYYKLKADNWKVLNAALFQAASVGLDPEVIDSKQGIFEIGTGNNEKVTALISKHNLDILVESDYQETGYRS
jgi:hypothetical protein